MFALWSCLGSEGLYFALLRQVQEPILERSAPEDGVTRFIVPGGRERWFQCLAAWFCRPAR